MIQLPDNDLLFALQNGDARAFDIIYQRYWGVLYSHAIRMVKDQDLAKDIVQEVFLSFYQKSEMLELKVSLSAYLYSSVRNKILDEIAKNKVRDKYSSYHEISVSSSECYTDHRVREKQLAKLIEREVALLPEKMRLVFELSRVSEKSYKEISAELGISDHTVKKQISNAIKILRFKLDATISVVVICLLS
ncbi:MAG: RNA polymerase sigma-70 factor [Pedobacter sp.]|nr:MAG: RNA polymerase sigma-70 factor [Pedobacter sp.]